MDDAQKAPQLISAPAPRGTETRRQAIIRAALRCLEKSGHAGLTARRIASEAGLSLGHLTYNFTGMHVIQAAAYHLAAERIQAKIMAFQTRPDASLAESLESYLHAALSPLTLPPDLLRVRIDLWANAQTSPAIAIVERRLHNAIRTQLETLLRQSSDPWKAERVPQIIDLIMATMEGLLLDRARHDNETAVRNAVEGCVTYARLRLG